jgi:uncharacterized repeat protein (TIGR01451 family)
MRWTTFSLRLIPCVIATVVLSGVLADTDLRSRNGRPGRAWLGQVEQQIRDSEYHLSWQTSPVLPELGPGWHAPNRAHNLRTYFTAQGIRVVERETQEPAWSWGLSLEAYGRAGSSSNVAAASLIALDARIDYARGAITEWYVNEPRGLKQGFDLSTPPDAMEHTTSDPVFLELSLYGTLLPQPTRDGRAIDFVTAGGDRVLRYAGLVVTDAGGDRLPSWIESFSIQGRDGIRLWIDDRGARYPLEVDPLTTTPDWGVSSDQDVSNFAHVVATAGDVNGDGYADVIVGAPYYDNGEQNEGLAFAYYGSASGPSVTPDWTGELDRANSQFGHSLATAGDVNGDGYSDVIIGAPLSSGTQADEGRVWVWHGSPTGLPAMFSWSVDSDLDGAQLGYSVASAGDVNGDGFADVIIGAPYFDNGEIDEGIAWVHLGSANGLSTTPSWQGESDQAGAAFGWSVSGAGDLDGDGYADVVVGVPFYTDTQIDQGAGFVYYGSATGPVSGPPDVSLQVAQNNTWCGWSVASAGDVDGDGFTEALLGCRYYDDVGLNEGGVFLFEGSIAGIGTTASWVGTGASNNDEFGFSVATAGDTNGDGYADVIIGAPSADNGETLEGIAYMYEGSATGLSLTPAWSTESNQSFSNYGGSVATAGDVDGDGLADVLVGASRYDDGHGFDGGRAFLYRGSIGGLDESALWTTEGDQVGAEMSYSVASAGDVNADGFGDVIIGAPFHDNGLDSEGRAQVHFGSGAGLETSAAWTVDGGQAGGKFGWSVDSAGDVNGDGFSDVIVGAPGFMNGEPTEGIAFVFHGSPTDPSYGADWFADSNQTGSEFGAAVAGAGDVNGDGYGDVIVGAPNFGNGQSGEGGAWVYLGSPAGLDSVAIWSAEGGQAGAKFGFSVGTAGDVDGDSLAEVIVGAPSYDAGLADQGRTFAYLGTVFGPVTQPFWTADGPHATAGFGYSVDSAGDVNGDAHSEVIVGAPQYSNGQVNEGAAFAFLGSTLGLSGAPFWSTESDQVGASMGRSVACAGDINGDGYSDVVVGAPQFADGVTDGGQARVYTGSVSGLSTSPSWTATGEDNVRFGWSVAAAGDVNSDGYADVIVGAPWQNDGEAKEGRASLYYGNGFGTFLAAQQRQPNNLSAIGSSGASVGSDEFRLTAFGRSPFGMGDVKLQWEVKPLGTPFDGVPSGTSPAWLNTILPTVPPAGGFNSLANGLTPGTAYHWRVRELYSPGTTPFQQFSRWFSVPSNGAQELDLRVSASVDLDVAQVDSKDPVFVGETFSYTIDSGNAGPDGIDVTLRDPLPAGVSLQSVVPSQGDCVEADHVLTCRFGRLEETDSASAVVTVVAQAAGLQINTVQVGSPRATDSDPGNDEETIDTLVKSPAVGNRVWEDTNGDGIQDAGEPGMANVLVVLYASDDSFIDTAVTNGLGAYTVPGLVYANDYYLRFFPPPGYLATLPGQGADDELDSDADPFTLQTPVFSLVEQSDLVRWDTGMIPNCVAPDEPVYIESMGLTTDGNEFPILNYLDPNQPSQITGYNVYRSSDPIPPPATWPLMATDVIDMDEATPNKQWVDTTGDVSPSGVWYYKVSGYNHRCPAEGPL